MESNVRQFVPITMRAQEGSVREHLYFIVCPAETVDALDYDKSSLVEQPSVTGSGAMTRRHIYWGGDGIVFHPDKLVGRHFWRSGERGIYKRFFVSDELKKRIEEWGLIGMNFAKCRPSSEVKREWDAKKSGGK